jgi:hypothetical protein
MSERRRGDTRRCAGIIVDEVMAEMTDGPGMCPVSELHVPGAEAAAAAAAEQAAREQRKARGCNPSASDGPAQAAPAEPGTGICNSAGPSNEASPSKRGTPHGTPSNKGTPHTTPSKGGRPRKSETPSSKAKSGKRSTPSKRGKPCSMLLNTSVIPLRIQQSSQCAGASRSQPPALTSSPFRKVTRLMAAQNASAPADAHADAPAYALSQPASSHDGASSEDDSSWAGSDLNELAEQPKSSKRRRGTK